MPPRRSFNPKRRVCSPDKLESRRDVIASLGRPEYRGNPAHKRNPGDFGLTPPSSPRLGKTLCDSVGVFTREEAQRLLTAGLDRGLFSNQERNGWPQYVWAVTPDNQPVEAQLEGNGAYHGYPMPENDPFRDEVLTRWSSSQ